jgi:hypothetical protein
MMRTRTIATGAGITGSADCPPAFSAAFLAGCRDSVSLPGDLKRHQAKFFCITRCVALKRTRATSPCAGPRHDLSSRARSARTDLAQISRRVRAVIF